MEQHSSSSHQWPQGIGLVNSSRMSKNKPTMEEPNHSTNQGSNTKKMTNKGGKLEQGGGAMSCPRCSSLNTKFCYFNNYSLSQPRHFCKTCRRYWTQGGSLRSVPVGGGSRRKNTTANNNRQPQQPPPTTAAASSSMFPPISTFPSHQNSHRFALDDLNLSYPPPIVPDSGHSGSNNANDRSKGLSSMMMMGTSFMQDLGFSSPPGFHSTLLDFKPATSAAASSPLLNFSLARDDGDNINAGFDIGGRGGFRLGLQEEREQARVLFPKQDMTSNTGAATDDHQADRSGAGFWNHGLLLGGSASWIHGNHQIQ